MKLRFVCELAILCAASAVWSQRLEPFGLQGMHVTTLAVSPAAASINWNHRLFAGTDSLGVFVRDLSEPDSTWSSTGLRGKRISALYVYHFGVGPAEFNRPFAGVEPNLGAGDSTLLYGLSDAGQWVAADSGMNRALPGITAIGGIFYQGHEPPQPLFAGGGERIYRSWTADSGWEQVLQLSSPLNVLAVYQRAWGGTVWAGGGPGGWAFAPWIARSDDGGTTWESVSPDDIAYHAVLALAIHPESPDTVYAGLHGAVLKTVDGGKTWNSTSLSNAIISFRGLAIDPADPEHVYAGGDMGRDPEPRVFVLFESFDGGSTWYQVAEPTMFMKRGLWGITSLAVDPNAGGVLYIATRGDGVWRYEAPAKPPHTIYVPRHYPTIQAGLDAATPGDTVLVDPGTYIENIDFLGKNVVLKSRQGPETTIIDGNGTGSVVTFAAGETPATWLEGFTLRHGSGTVADNGVFGGGIFCKSSSPTITRNVIVENTVFSICASFGGGMAVTGESTPVITHNRISGNSLGSTCDGLVSFGGGVYISGRAAPRLRENTITHNWADRGGGIAVVDSAQPAIESNTIGQNQPGGILVTETAAPRIGGAPGRGNDIVDNLGGGIGEQLLRMGHGERINAQYNHLGVCPPTEQEVFPLDEFDTAYCSSASLRNYFPMEIGNRWTFGTIASITEAISDTLRIAGSLFFRFNEFRSQADILLRLREDNKLTWRIDPMSVLEHVWVDFAAEVGDRWEVMPSYGWTVELQSKTDTVRVPAGTFTDCYRFYFYFHGDDNDWVEWYAPGIGPVKRVNFGFATIEYPLTSAVIHGLVVGVGETPALREPRAFVLHPSHPNPFNAATTISYDLPEPALVTLEMYNLLGQKVRLLAADWMPSGPHRLVWDGRDDAGSALPSGIYFCKAVIKYAGTAEPVRQIRRTALVK